MAIRLDGLGKSFGNKLVLDNLNLEIPRGAFVSLVGPSGCGKSTVLRLIAGLEMPTQGHIHLEDLEKNHFGFIFQEPQLLPWRTVRENIALPFELQKSINTATNQKLDTHHLVEDVLKKVKLQDSGELFPHQLSGGMKMRASLARALVQKPHLLLMDEPFAALDEPTRFEMQDQLKELWLNEKLTIVFVTHSLFEATYVSQRVLMMKGVAGEIALDEALHFSNLSGEKLRTSAELNLKVKEISERLRA